MRIIKMNAFLIMKMGGKVSSLFKVVEFDHFGNGLK